MGGKNRELNSGGLFRSHANKVFYILIFFHLINHTIHIKYYVMLQKIMQHCVNIGARSDLFILLS